MVSNWIITLTAEEWNEILKNNGFENNNGSQTLSENDLMCFYVLGTSSIKGTAIKCSEKLILQKVGDLNYFGIANDLQFVKDKENVIKYLKNFKGVANLGKSISKKDFELINSQMTPHTIPEESIVEEEIKIETKLLKPGTSHQTMFELEVNLRTFVSGELLKISDNWMKERIPDPNMLSRWKERMTGAKKQRAWLEDEENELIQFSDFYDLLTLIVNRGNWKKCFENIFGKQSIIESKMYELIPIRNKLAHNRSLTGEEKMMLELYSAQILRIIKKSS